VHEDLQAQFLGDSHGFIGAVVIYENFDVRDVGDFADGFLERLLRVIGGHDYDDALAVNHFRFPVSGCSCRIVKPGTHTLHGNLESWFFAGAEEVYPGHFA
jgi:hypothetical protein